MSSSVWVFFTLGDNVTLQIKSLKSVSTLSMDHVSDGYVEVCDVNVTANEINCLSFPIQNDIQSGIKGGGGEEGELTIN